MYVGIFEYANWHLARQPNAERWNAPRHEHPSPLRDPDAHQMEAEYVRKDEHQEHGPQIDWYQELEAVRNDHGHDKR